MGSRWRQEDYSWYARMHFDLDSHDAYATTDDDPARFVPNPAKKKAHKRLLAARARHDRGLAATAAAMLEAVSPPPPESLLITNAAHDGITADLRAASASLDTAQAAHWAVPARVETLTMNYVYWYNNEAPSQPAEQRHTRGVRTDLARFSDRLTIPGEPPTRRHDFREGSLAIHSST